MAQENQHDDEREVERDIDQEIHINEMRHELEELGGMFTAFETPLSSDIEEAFLEQVLAYEHGPFTTHLELLNNDKVFLPPPEEITDEAMPELLKALIDALARRQTFISSTDHLSDREVYTHLWRESLREETLAVEPSPNFHCGIDLLGSGSEEDNQIYLKYYASEETRAQWAREFPRIVMPPHEDPPYDRDRHLPQPVLPTFPDNEDDIFLDDPLDDGECPF